MYAEEAAAGVEAESYQFERHVIVVEQFDWVIVAGAIRRMLDSLGADDWETLAGKIGQYGQWEFEDYVDPGVASPG